MTDTNQAPNRDAATVLYVETSLATLADALRQACSMIERLTAKHLRAILATVDGSLGSQPAYEHQAGHTWLSPRYFTLASEVQDLRARLACALVVAEIHDCIALAEPLLEAIRQREPGCPDPRVIFDGLTRAICGALDAAEMPGNAAWREMIERAVYPLTDLWAEARARL